ncbi:putative transcription factor C2H2 family [Helianthus annuus]|uniref:RING-type E3 ubiquitin transferase n=1 Tax=Helianthus annuus TaxID=4232 RepID=A0A251SGS5_HELAN|nr:E3 ubiquitin-protein ligase MBR2 [Helianthus annuus]KAF5768891.1 putative transcription factor C2H2 family [Helianthus annuus]KAJ0464042.1 putative transcription factor C2H2 family [Helianthus annuus]KAJ0485582.1 putative transcription factor C2H2 family [Helianthus annuus]KAJ0656134.1 putative transcription factor C2H2 family [Helianthus annuus]
MDPYYDHHPILQQQYYAYSVPAFPVPAEWVVMYDQVNTPAHYTMMPMFYPQPVQYVNDVAILNTMWVNQEQHPMHSYFQNQNYVPYNRLIHEFEAFLEERLMRIEQEAGPALQQVNAGTRGSGLSEEEISEHLQVYTAQGKMSEVDACCICLGEYEKEEKMGRLECGHRFHAECIRRWLLSKNVCPMCRSTALSV